LSHEPRPIKVVDTALSETTKADKIAIESTKTGKVTAVVMVMSIFKKKRCKLWSANLKNERPSCQKMERANFPEKNTRGSRSPSQKFRKGQIPKKLSPTSKKLELNRTNLMLNSKNTHQITPKHLIQALALDYMSKIRQLGSYLPLGHVVTSFS
jgi:hypothetical protein